MEYNFTGLFILSQPVFILACIITLVLIMNPSDEIRTLTCLVFAFALMPAFIALSFFAVYGPTAVALNLTEGFYSAAGAENVFVNVFSAIVIGLSVWMVERAIQYRAKGSKRAMATRNNREADMSGS